MLSEVQSKCGVRGRSEHHERESTTNRNENPKEGTPRPQGRRVDGLTSTPRQRPSWDKRGGWGKVTMISRGVEISIAGGGGEIVRGPISWSEPSALYGHLPTTLTLVTYHLALHNPL